jgi:hypothetical protein
MRAVSMLCETDIARAIAAVRLAAVCEAFPYSEPAFASAQKEQVLLLRDMVDNPFRPVALDPAWLVWNGGTMLKLAQPVYDEQAFHRLPVLADALEEAGCTDAGILAHCRGPGPHVRGCWVVDLILGKG